MRPLTVCLVIWLIFTSNLSTVIDSFQLPNGILIDVGIQSLLSRNGLRLHPPLHIISYIGYNSHIRSLNRLIYTDLLYKTTYRAPRSYSEVLFSSNQDLGEDAAYTDGNIGNDEYKISTKTKYSDIVNSIENLDVTEPTSHVTSVELNDIPNKPSQYSTPPNNHDNPGKMTYNHYRKGKVIGSTNSDISVKKSRLKVAMPNVPPSRTKQFRQDQIVKSSRDIDAPFRPTVEDARFMSVNPTSKCKTISYDYLAQSSLDAINFGNSKGRDKYLQRWWTVAKRWNLLSGEMKELEARLNQSRKDPSVLSKDDENFDVTATQGKELADTLQNGESLEDLFDDFDRNDDASEFKLTDESKFVGYGQSAENEDNFYHSDDDSLDDDLVNEEEIQVFPGDDISMNITTENLRNSGPDYTSYTIADNAQSASNNISNGNDFRFIHSNETKETSNIPFSSVSSQRQSASQEFKFRSQYAFYQNVHLRYNEIPLVELINFCKNRRAKVICISDVHGCLEELVELIREVNYQPGDLIVFLGDLVAKGLYSVEVIQLAMDLGAVVVRGNHEHEVVRQGLQYFRGIKTRRQNEHCRIALQLNARQFKWLCQLPYYVKSPDLGSIFVHAGFHAGIPPDDQDPWNMMTIRSTLPDGRPSPRCFYKHPWADQWQGPLTVYFGHDAARGLQVYDNAVGLDTGCVYGGHLSAIILPDKELVSVKAKRAYQNLGKSSSYRMYEWSKANEHQSIQKMFSRGGMKSKKWKSKSDVSERTDSGNYITQSKELSDNSIEDDHLS